MTNAQGDIRLLLADVDGTLVTQEKILTDQAVAATQELHEAGITLALTSGRPPRGMSMLIAPLRLEGAIAGFNGGVFVHPDLSVIESHLLDAATARETLQLILDQGLDAWVYTEKDWLIRDAKAPHVARETWTVKFDAKVVSSFTDADLAKVAKIVGVSDDLDRVAACEKTAQQKLGERASAARSQPYYLDVTNPQANKGTVVLTLAKLRNISPAQIATIGDMPNDVLMFRKSGLSIAMGNSSDEVKSQATAVTDSNQNEGFAKAVRKFILKDDKRPEPSLRGAPATKQSMLRLPRMDASLALAMTIDKAATFSAAWAAAMPFPGSPVAPIHAWRSLSGSVPRPASATDAACGSVRNRRCRAPRPADDSRRCPTSDGRRRRRGSARSRLRMPRDSPRSAFPG